MSKKGRVLAAIFAEPVRANISWHDVEGLFQFLGAEIREAAGSRVLVALNGVRAVFHEPHPEKELRKPAVRAVRDFLRNAGVAP
jgi:HicA toxin of bacterial toxin-antitoxin,